MSDNKESGGEIYVYFGNLLALAFIYLKLADVTYPTAKARGL